MTETCGLTAEGAVESLLPGPPILSFTSSAPSRTSASRSAAFSLTRLPPTTTLGLWRVQLSIKALAMTERGRQLLRRQPEMHEVAETSPVAFSVFILSAARFTEIRDWGELRVQWSARIPPVVQIFDSGLGFRFPFKAGVNVSDEMITNVITHLFIIVSA